MNVPETSDLEDIVRYLIKIIVPAIMADHDASTKLVSSPTQPSVGRLDFDCCRMLCCLHLFAHTQILSSLSIAAPSNSSLQSP